MSTHCNAIKMLNFNIHISGLLQTTHHEIRDYRGNANSKGPDQSAHSHNLIRDIMFVDRSYVTSDHLIAIRKPWLDRAHAQT